MGSVGSNPDSLLGLRAKSHISDQPTYGQVVGLVQRYAVRDDLSGVCPANVSNERDTGR